MANKVQIKRTSVSGNVPTAAQLEVGELAVNLADKTLWTKDGSNAVIQLNAASGGGSGTVTNVATGAGLTGGPITTTGTISLSASGVTAGTYNSVTVDTYGRVTAGTNPTTLASHGITDGVVSTRQVTGTTSLAGGGDLTADRTITLLNDAAAPGNNFFYGTSAAGVKGWRDLSALGYVVGPATATDNAIARYDTTTGKLIQNSLAILDDAGNLSGVNNLTTTGNTILGDAAADTYTLNGSTMAVPNNLNIDNNTLMIDAANNRIGLGTATPLSTLDIVGLLSESPVALSGGAQNINLALGRSFSSAVSATTTYSITNTPAGKAVRLVMTITNGGSQTINWPAITWLSGSAPTLKASGTDVILLWTFDGGTNWYGASAAGASGSRTVSGTNAFLTGFDVPAIGSMVAMDIMVYKTPALTNSRHQLFFSYSNDGVTWTADANNDTINTRDSAHPTTLTHQARLLMWRRSATALVIMAHSGNSGGYAASTTQTLFSPTEVQILATTTKIRFRDNGTATVLRAADIAGVLVNA